MEEVTRKEQDAHIDYCRLGFLLFWASLGDYPYPEGTLLCGRRRMG